MSAATWDPLGDSPLLPLLTGMIQYDRSSNLGSMSGRMCTLVNGDWGWRYLRPIGLEELELSLTRLEHLHLNRVCT